MRSQTSRHEYERRLNLVVNHVAEHLDEPLSLEVLAGIAAWSPYHFHRIFKAMMGETVAEFVWRLRLERAANQLRTRSEASITRIALDCGFATPSSFSRAFRQRFGVTASGFRQESPGSILRNLGTDDERLPPYAPGMGAEWPLNRQGNTSMDVEIQDLPAFHVAYVRRHGYAKGEFQQHLNDAFQQVCAWVAHRDLFGAETLVIGVPHDNPDITPFDRCRYDACVTIPGEVSEPSDGIAIQTLAGGQYAVRRIDVRDPAEIGREVDALYGQWLPTSGYQADDRPCLEIYRDSGETPPGSRIVLDFCIPVTPLRR
jgi:AraC family transcriptional regulator